MAVMRIIPQNLYSHFPSSLVFEGSDNHAIPFKDLGQVLLLGYNKLVPQEGDDEKGNH